jgi:hypothetical protein
VAGTAVARLFFARNMHAIVLLVCVLNRKISLNASFGRGMGLV